MAPPQYSRHPTRRKQTVQPPGHATVAVDAGNGRTIGDAAHAAPAAVPIESDSTIDVARVIASLSDIESKWRGNSQCSVALHDYVTRLRTKYTSA